MGTHPIISCFIKIQIGSNFLGQLTHVVLENRPLNGYLFDVRNSWRQEEQLAKCSNGAESHVLQVTILKQFKVHYIKS